MGLEEGITILTDVFFKTGFANQYWIMQITIIIATLALITRKFSDWKGLTLPVMVGWSYFGMNLNWMFYTVASALFVIDTLSIQYVNSAIGSVMDTFSFTNKQGGIRQARANAKTTRASERMNIKEQMEELGYKMKSSEERATMRDIERYKKTLGTVAGRNEMQEKMKGTISPQKILQYAGENNAMTDALTSRFLKSEGQRFSNEQYMKRKMNEGKMDKRYLTSNEAKQMIRNKKKRIKEKNNDWY